MYDEEAILDDEIIAALDCVGPLSAQYITHTLKDKWPFWPDYAEELQFFLRTFTIKFIPAPAKPRASSNPPPSPRSRPATPAAMTAAPRPPVHALAPGSPSSLPPSLAPKRPSDDTRGGALADRLDAPPPPAKRPKTVHSPPLEHYPRSHEAWASSLPPTQRPPSTPPAYLDSMFCTPGSWPPLRTPGVDHSVADSARVPRHPRHLDEQPIGRASSYAQSAEPALLLRGRVSEHIPARALSTPNVSSSPYPCPPFHPQSIPPVPVSPSPFTYRHPSPSLSAWHPVPISPSPFAYRRPSPSPSPLPYPRPNITHVPSLSQFYPYDTPSIQFPSAQLSSTPLSPPPTRPGAPGVASLTPIHPSQPCNPLESSWDSMRM